MTTAGTREHGTRARYVHGPGPGKGPGCRCDECTAANLDSRETVRGLSPAGALRVSAGR